MIIILIVCIVCIALVLGEQKKSAEEIKEKESPETPSSRRSERKKTDNSISLQDTLPLEWPSCDPAGVIRHLAYDLCYDEKSEQASWVAYQLTASETIKRYDRSNHFLEDPLIKTKSAGDRDYKGSGYDRGHLAPAADMGWSLQSMEESFYYSNMSPQSPSFNRGIWKRLEEQVRSWAVWLDTIYVVTGPVLKGNMAYIGPERVAVPNYYYKAILKLDGKDTKAIGFIMANESGKGSLDQYAVSIDSLEKFTGLDFFVSLSNTLESKVESELCISCWDWHIKRSSSSASNNKNQSGGNSSVQCSGFTLKGNRCKRMTKNSSGRCYQHQ